MDYNNSASGTQKTQLAPDSAKAMSGKDLEKTGQWKMSESSLAKERGCFHPERNPWAVYKDHLGLLAWLKLGMFSGRDDRFDWKEIKTRS